jgi:hypothetical protein
MRAFLCLLVLLPVSAFAQVQPTVSYTVNTYASTATDPTTAPLNTGTYAVGVIACGQVRPAPGTVTPVNPDRVRFIDPANDALDCVIQTAAMATQLASLPVGTGYKASARANGASLQSGWSPFSNSFSRALGAPPAPQGVVVQ